MIPWQLHEFPSSERCISIQGVLASGSTLIPNSCSQSVVAMALSTTFC